MAGRELAFYDSERGSLYTRNGRGADDVNLSGHTFSSQVESESICHSLFPKSTLRGDGPGVIHEGVEGEAEMADKVLAALGKKARARQLSGSVCVFIPATLTEKNNRPAPSWERVDRAEKVVFAEATQSARS